MRPNPNYVAYDIAANAKRIAAIDNPIARRQEIAKAPRAFQAGVSDAVGILFRQRCREQQGGR